MPQISIPNHVAIIMDGNGRWAAQKGLPRSAGHQAGAEPVRAVITAAKKAGVKFLTLYAFSTENWGRPEEEVSGLFELLLKYLERELNELVSGGVALKVIGDIESLPQITRQALDVAIEASANCDELVLTLALSYGSRVELARAARLLAEEVSTGQRLPSSITPEALAEKLWTADTPEPDFLIRTGGDIRLSNFLLWQCAYAELYFTKVLWPDFGEDDFNNAISSFKNRERRFGLSEPLQSSTVGKFEK